MSRTCQFYGALVILASVGLGAGARDVRLVNAAEERNAKAALALLKQGADPKSAQPDGATALHWAAHWNEVALAKALMAGGANVNAANDYGVTPLHLAATNGSLEMTEALLTAGADARSALPSGETVLMTATRGGNAAVVIRLLKAGADPNVAQLSKGQTALMWAATAQNVEVAKALLAGGASVKVASKAGFTPLLFAAREGGVDMVKVLLGAGAQLEEKAKDGSTAILAATVQGHAPLAMFLLEQGARADGAPEAGYTPLHWASARFDDMLAPVEPVTTGEWRSLLGMPDRKEKLALIGALLAKGADVNAKATRGMPRVGFGASFSGATPFIVAAGSGDAEVMKMLLAKGADAKLRGSGGVTAVMVASEGNGDTSVMAPEAGRIEAISVALAAGVGVEDADEKGYRAMHKAAESGFHKILKFLLDKGADINAVTNSRVEKDYGASTLQVAGQSPLGIVEGTFTGGIIRERPETAAYLRTLGAKSIGKATLDSYVKQFDTTKKQ